MSKWWLEKKNPNWENEFYTCKIRLKTANFEPGGIRSLQSLTQTTTTKPHNIRSLYKEEIYSYLITSSWMQSKARLDYKIAAKNIEEKFSKACKNLGETSMLSIQTFQTWFLFVK